MYDQVGPIFKGLCMLLYIHLRVISPIVADKSSQFEIMPLYTTYCCASTNMNIAVNVASI